MVDKDIYVPELEWESINFPLTIAQIRFEEINYGFSEEAKIIIWRDEVYQLRGKISGFLKDPKQINQDNFIGKGNIIRKGNIAGIDSLGNTVKLLGCLIINFHSNSWKFNENVPFIKAELLFDTVNINFRLQHSALCDTSIQFNWFLCNSTFEHFDGCTYRNLKHPVRKVRVGIDENHEECQKYYEGSRACDFTLINLQNLECILAEAPSSFLSKGMKGIYFEFRDNFSRNIHPQLLDNLRHFVEFLLGAKMYAIGHSIVEEGILKEAFLTSPKIREMKCAMPPIKYNITYDWGKISLVINKLLPQYLSLQEGLNLNNVVERYWIAQSIPIGSNLPVLSSAIEILAEQYLKMIEKTNLEHIPKEVYRELIEDEIKQIELKLFNKNGSDAILRKIKDAYQMGPNEKIRLFFSLLKIELGKSEKKAIKLRNNMAHSMRNYKDDEIAYNDVIMTRVYQALFNRVVLKLLGYDGYYIDYSLTNSPSKYIDVKAGIE
jgi:hypothetical protein